MKPAQAAFKQTLLRQMLLGLRLSASPCSPHHDDRKAAVRLAADAALASARGPGRPWTRALACRLLDRDRLRRCRFLHFVLGSQFTTLARGPRSKSTAARRSTAMRSAAAESEAEMRKRRRSLVAMRTRELKRLVPGGEAMDGACLLAESLDYAVALRAQVELMQSLVADLEASVFRGQNGSTILGDGKASFVGK